MRVSAAIERELVTILLRGLRRTFAASLTLSRLVAARLLLHSGEHEVLLAGDAAAPYRRCGHHQREERIGNDAKHAFVYDTPSGYWPSLVEHDLVPLVH